MRDKARSKARGPGKHRDPGARGGGGSSPGNREVGIGSPAIERLERYLLVVTPRQPVVDWIRRLGPVGNGAEYGPAYTLEEARAYHRSAYLVPVAEDAHDVESWVEDNFDLIFEQELYAVTPDRRRWPRKRSADAFMEWFSLELLDSPIDLVDAPLVAPRHGTRHAE